MQSNLLSSSNSPKHLRSICWTFCVRTGHNMTITDANHPVSTAEFLGTHPVFNLEVARQQLPGDARQRVAHAVEQGRVVRLRRELFAVVPPGQNPETFQPDQYLVMSHEREDAVLAGHSALELLGQAHSVWNKCVGYSNFGRSKFSIKGFGYEVVGHPTPLGSQSNSLGVLESEHMGMPIRHLGPERSLIDGFHRPRLSGGVTELVLSLDGLRLLNLKLVEELLAIYKQKTLVGAVGWFLSRHQERFFVSDGLLQRLESKVPATPHYLERAAGRSQLVKRWNVFVPLELMRTEEKDY
jgi:predicted transcriptional regulator of viral defense system